MNHLPPARTPVIVSNPDHERTGQAGVSIKAGEAAESVVVQFDADGAAVEVALADLRAL